MKDWVGNSKSIHTTLGASNHSDFERQTHDYYATDPIAIPMLAQTGFFDGASHVWEPACGGGHLVTPMRAMGLLVKATDLYDYGAGMPDVDFLKCEKLWVEDIDAIVTNPPYKYALEFCEKCVELGVPKFAMFLKLTFLEGAKRQAFFKDNPPRYVAVCVNRISCALNGDKEEFAKSSAACYAWFIWEKGFTGHPEILWLTRP